MPILQFILDIYIAASLGIAGLAKLDNTSLFIVELQHKYKFPELAAKIAGKYLPWGEIFLAISLLTPAVPYRFIVTCGILFMFITFFASKILLIKENRFNFNCGCYGEITKKQNAFQSIVTLTIQIALVILLMIVTLWSPSLPWQYYLVCLVLLIGFYSWLVWKMWKRQQAFAVGNH